MCVAYAEVLRTGDSRYTHYRCSCGAKGQRSNDELPTSFDVLTDGQVSSEVLLEVHQVPDAALQLIIGKELEAHFIGRQVVRPLRL